VPAADFVTATHLADFTGADSAAIVEQVQGAIRAYCGWHIAPELADVEVTLDGHGSRHLWLPSLYVTDITGVINEGETLAAADYDWSADGYLERRNGWWSRRPRQVTVTFTHGYAETPPELIGLAVAIAARAVASPTGAGREQAGGVSRGYATFNGVSGGIALLEHEKEILAQYKLPPRP